MRPHYTAIQDGDVEKQPLVSDYQHDHSCQCGRQQQQLQEQNHRSRPSKSTVAIFVLILLLFVGYGRNVCQMKHDHSSHSIQTSNIQQQRQPSDTPSSLSSNLEYCSRDYPLGVHWDGKSVYEFGQEITSLSVEQKFDDHHFSAKTGEVIVVENKKLEKTKVAFDIKLNSDLSQDAIRIDEVWSDHALSLTVVTDDHDRGNGCIKIDVLVEVPSSAALDDLALKFINNNIILMDKLQLKDFLAVSTVSGHLTVKKPTTAPKISLSLASGDINGVFDVDQVEFSATSVSGNTNLVFERISSASTIHTSTTSGNIDLQVPSDFESKFDLSIVFGNVDLKAKETKKLHSRRSGGVVGHKVHGYYGDDESPSSQIKMDVVSGNVKLNYH